VGIYWAVHRARKRKISPTEVMDLSLIIVIAAIVGSRLMYVLTHLDEFRGRWFDTINPFQSTGEIGIAGLTMLGGVVLSLAAIVVYCAVKGIPILRLCDVMAPSFALGLALTRIGCFLNGCCFGKPSHLPWAMVFPLSSPAGSIHQGIPIHPTQVYASASGLLILAVLLVLDRKPRFDGFLMSVFFMMYGILRILEDTVRYYESSVQFSLAGVQVTFNQLIAFLMALFGVAVFLSHFVFQRRLRKKT
jgi:phosphatidylglycerol:prolipoprotein diacylglycerol transferase